MRKSTLLFITFNLIYSGTMLWARTNPLTSYADLTDKVIAASRSKTSIQIDGFMDEQVWLQASVGEGFIQRDPDEGKPGTERTQFRIVYDEKNLYVCVCAFDTEPTGIKGILTRRDESSPSDWISVSIDSYNDKRTAFEFGLNPKDVKFDRIIFNNGEIDFNWDPIWDGAAQIDSSGWTAEFKIPFKELRFSEGEQQQWGIQVMRIISRKNEEQFWTYIPKNESGWVSHYGTLTGIQSVPHQKRLYLAPYLTGGSAFSQDYITTIHSDQYKFTQNVGLDAKYGLTNNLTLDITLNPDFGQVEADPGVLNLSAFETYFPEKRPFFIEGSNILNLNLGFGDGDNTRNTLFYSRRIGRSPQRNLDCEIEDDTTWAKMPQMTTILGAAKITGKTESGWSIGVLSALTQEEMGRFIYNNQNNFKTPVEPLTNYSVTRLQKDFREGQTTVGGILTSTFRKIDDPNLNFLHDRAITGGFDFTHFFRNRRYLIDASLAFSHIHGSPEALEVTQTSPQRYFQRPDAKHLKFDLERTHLEGFSHKLVVAKMGGGHWRWATGIIGFSPGFETNDLGYVQLVDDITQFIWIGYRENEPGKIFRNYGINLNQWTSWNYGGIMTNSGSNVNSFAQFPNYWSIDGGIGFPRKGLNAFHLRGGPAIVTSPRINVWGGFSSDQRKKVQIGFNGFQWYGTDDKIRGYNLAPILTIRPTYNLNASIQPTYLNNRDTWEWIDQPEDNEGNKHYIFAHLDQELFSIVFRLNYTISSTLSMQFYAEPFITAGTYSGYKEVVAPRAEKFIDRFHEFSDQEIRFDNTNEEYYIDRNQDGETDFSFNLRDFNYQQYRSNLVLRWEYRPGSVLYLVWSQGYTDFDTNGIFQLDQDVRNLFSANPENVFMIKLSYLLDM